MYCIYVSIYTCFYRYRWSKASWKLYRWSVHQQPLSEARLPVVGRIACGLPAQRDARWDPWHGWTWLNLVTYPNTSGTFKIYTFLIVDNCWDQVGSKKSCRRKHPTFWLSQKMDCFFSSKKWWQVSFENMWTSWFLWIYHGLASKILVVNDIDSTVTLIDLTPLGLQSCFFVEWLQPICNFFMAYFGDHKWRAAPVLFSCGLRNMNICINMCDDSLSL